MPKKLLATTIILILSVTMLSLAPVSRGNFIPTNAEIHVLEPRRQTIEIYDDIPIPVTVEIREPENAPQNYHQITRVNYCIDEQPAVEIANITKKTNQPFFSGTVTEYNAYTTIDNLESGSHILTVFALDDVGNRLSAKTGFAYQTIDKYPNVTIFSPLNTTYFNTTQLAVNFTADNFIDAYYHLDGTIRGYTLQGNGTLTQLTDGAHKTELFVQTQFGSFSQTIEFAIEGANSPGTSQDSTRTPSITLTPSRENSDKGSVSTIVMMFVIVVVLVWSLLVFLRRRGIDEAK
jgi:hypothetical protein